MTQRNDALLTARLKLGGKDRSSHRLMRMADESTRGLVGQVGTTLRDFCATLLGGLGHG